jgi:hypothetical protein
MIAVAMIGYIVKVRPMESERMNWIEIYNEVTLVITNLLVVGFTD